MTPSTLLTVQEVADQLAISGRGVYRLISQGQIAFVSLGKKCYRFRPEDVAAFVRGRTKTKKVDECQFFGTRPRPAGAWNYSATDDELARLLQKVQREGRQSNSKRRSNGAGGLKA